VCSNAFHVTDTRVNYIWSYIHVMLKGVSFTNTTQCSAAVTNVLFFLNNTFPIECFTCPVLWSQGYLQTMYLLLYKLHCTRLYLCVRTKVEGGGAFVICQCETVRWHFGVVQITFKFFSWSNLTLNSFHKITFKKFYGLNINESSWCCSIWSLFYLFSVYCLMLN
jgi:hypothetical protein